MAKNEIVWGIDVGNTSLKALRCRLGSEPGKLEVLGFDFIEHSKVMSQPGADPAAILAESLALFLSRNDIKGEKVAVAVSGQSALWRFQPLPPVDPRKIKDLVKYEVRQWLPFNLDDVIWTFRQVGGMKEGNLLLDANIFMYAMKKELTNKVVQNYSENHIDVDAIQGAPVALYNCYVHNFFEPGELDDKSPLEMNDYDIILNVGTDTTEVVITNGVSLWLRNIPIGGNLFTKALTKSLKLTFSNAEHIKRNAATSQDPKAVILAMKPVFTEMQSEIDRSIKYYCSLNKTAKIRRIYALGNAMKLPGLRQFLAKSHGLEVIVPKSFDKLEGQEVLANPQFRENLSSFAVSYGLALQLLHQGTLDVNLVPPEVIRDRMINSKKPWALAAAAILLLALAIQYVGSTTAFGTVKNDMIASAYKSAKSVHDKSTKLEADVKKAVSDFKKMDTIGKTLTTNVEGRLTWLELIKVVNSFIPDESLPQEVFSKNAREKAQAISEQNRIYIQNIEVVPVDDLSSWFEGVRRFYSIDDQEAEAFKAAEDGDSSALDAMFAFPEAPQFGISTMAAATGGEKGGKGGKGSKGAKGGKASPKAGGAAKAGGPAKAGGAAGAAGAGGGASGKAGAKGAKGGKGAKGAKGGGAESTESAFQVNVDTRLEQIPGPSGAGKVVQLTGYHYHNPNDMDDPNRGPEYIRRNVLPRIKHGSIDLPVSLERQRTEGGAAMETFTYKEFGIYYPVMVNPGQIDDNYRVLDPEAANKEFSQLKESNLKGRSGSVGGTGAGRTSATGMGGGMTPGMDGMMPGMGGMPGMGMPGMGGSMPGLGAVANNLSKNNSEKVLNLRRFDFVIQFVWQETPPSIRESRKAEAEKAAEAATDGTPGAAGGPGKGKKGNAGKASGKNANGSDSSAGENADANAGGSASGGNAAGGGTGETGTSSGGGDSTSTESTTSGAEASTEGEGVN